MAEKLPNYFQQSWDKYYTGDKNYYVDTTVRDKRYPHLEGDIESDVCIVGGGFMGLATAYFLRNSGLKVVLLERHETGFGGSGRNGGQILPGYTPDVLELAKKYGDDVSKRLWDLSIEGVSIVKNIIRDHQIDCDFKPGAVYLAENALEDKQMRREADTLIRRFQYNMEYKDADDIAEMMGTEFYYSGIYKPDAGHFQPLKYVQALTQIVHSHGVHVYESTAAEAIRKVGDGYVVHTPNGLIRSRRVVLCGDSYLGALVPDLRKKYVLIRNAIIGTAPIDPKLNIIPSDVCAYEISQYMHFYRKCADGTFIIGGGDVIKPQMSIMGTQEKIVNSLTEEMERIFPQLNGIRVKYQWGGNIAMTNTLLPNVGTIDENIFYANGFSGHGINVTHIVAKLVAEAILDKNADYRIFRKIDNMSYPGRGNWDPPLAYAGMQLYSLKGHIERIKLILSGKPKMERPDKD
jgi:gamma-glutamylputrescine oxidase